MPLPREAGTDADRAARAIAARCAGTAVRVGGPDFRGPGGPVEVPRAVRRACERALLAGATQIVRVDGDAWCAGAVSRPAPALVAARGTPAAAVRAVDAACSRLAARTLPEALTADPFLAARAASPSLAPLLAALSRIAAQPLTILLLGETGTGKEVVARAIHAASGRDGPFVAENCAAMPETLLEAELFGARRGAFTGADRDRSGRIVEAHGGTLFLDEIGDLPRPLQAKLLRVLQEREVRPLGGDRAIRVDLQVIAATHRDLADPRAAFRRDLFFRLAGYVCTLPPLRERAADLPFLCASLLGRIADDGIGPGRRLTAEALDRLAARPFPGNVRELDNALRRACALADGPLVGERLVAEPAATARSGPAANLEATMIEQALRLSGGVKAAAARRLGWSRQKLYRRLAALGLDGGRH